LAENLFFIFIQADLHQQGHYRANDYLILPEI